MVSLQLKSFCVLSLLMLASGLTIPGEPSLVARDNKVLKLDFHVVKYPKSAVASKINKVAHNGTVPVTLSNQATQYLLPLQVGSNKEEVIVAIDTGSSDLWVAGPDTVCSPLKNTPSDYCRATGTFSASQSLTWRDYHELFTIVYEDKTDSRGEYGTDDITLSQGFTFKDVIFASVNESSVGVSEILGIGFKSSEAAKTQYTNFPELVVNLGLTNRNAYSLYLNSVESATGSLIFGGIDHAKYEGSLITLPITSTTDLSVKLSSISSDNETVVESNSYVLVSGTQYTYVSNPEVFDKALNGYHSKRYNAYIVDCNPPADKYFTFEFDKNAKIKVPYTAFSGPLYDDNEKDTGLCIRLYDKGNFLGDNFLRSAYVVFDLDEKTISLAQAKYTSETNITTFAPKGT